MLTTPSGDVPADAETASNKPFRWRFIENIYGDCWKILSGVYLNQVGAELGKKAKYKQFYNLCKAKAVYATKRSDTMLVTQMPVELFTRAKRVIIMTYMFKGNVLDNFLKLKKVDVIPFIS